MLPKDSFSPNTTLEDHKALYMAASWTAIWGSLALGGRWPMAPLLLLATLNGLYWLHVRANRQQAMDYPVISDQCRRLSLVTLVVSFAYALDALVKTPVAYAPPFWLAGLVLFPLFKPVYVILLVASFFIPNDVRQWGLFGLWVWGFFLPTRFLGIFVFMLYVGCGVALVYA